MSKQLAGTTFIRNGLTYDYNFIETINCLLECCDKVFVVEAGSDDGTCEAIEAMEHPNLVLIKRTKEEWDAQQGTGHAKLCYFTDIAIEAAMNDGFEYHFCCQADEIIHESSYAEIRKAIATGAEGFLIKRINLWQDPYHQLNVVHDRKPCNDAIVRLAKTVYRSYGDAESLAVPYADAFFYEGIKLYHMGFVRKREVMKNKIINMQTKVFEMADYDKKLDLCEVFNPKLWFDGDDLKLIDEPLPKIIQEWAKERVYE